MMIRELVPLSAVIFTPTSSSAVMTPRIVAGCPGAGAAAPGRFSVRLARTLATSSASACLARTDGPDAAADHLGGRGLLIEGIERLGDLRDGGVFQRDDMERVPRPLPVDFREDPQDPVDVRPGVDDDQGVGGEKRREETVLGYDRSQQGDDLRDVDVLKGDQPRDDLGPGFLAPVRLRRPALLPGGGERGGL